MKYYIVKQVINGWELLAYGVDKVAAIKEAQELLKDRHDGLWLSMWSNCVIVRGKTRAKKYLGNVDEYEQS